MLRFDFALSEAEQAAIAAVDPQAWFTRVEFANCSSPGHPRWERLEQNNQGKLRAVSDWIAKVVPGSSVLDTFSANGAFSFLSPELGARRVVGVEFDAERVAAAELVAGIVESHTGTRPASFLVGDVYDLAARFDEPFDVSLCLGGLYHVADPPYVLRQLRAVTKEHLVVQTSSVIKGRRNAARFRVRSDARGKGLSSIVGGSGKWDVTVACFREMLRHGGFEVIEEKVSLPAYSALCRVV